MKRTLLVWGMAAVLLLSLFALTGCDEAKQPTAYKLVNDAVAKTKALDSWSATMTVETAAYEDMDADALDGATTSYDIQAMQLRSESPVVMMKAATTRQDSREWDIYIEDGYCYISAPDNFSVQKIRTTEEDANGYEGLTLIRFLLVELPEELFRDTAFVTTEKGRTVRLTPDDQTFKTVYRCDDSAVYSDIVAEFTVSENGYVAGCTLSFVEKKSLTSSEEITMARNMVVDFNDPGQPVTVTAPEGYLEYPEADLHSLYR